MPDSFRYDEVCPDCESWDLRLFNEEYNEELDRWEFDVFCRECCAEFKDWVEEL